MGWLPWKPLRCCLVTATTRHWADYVSMTLSFPLIHFQCGTMCLVRHCSISAHRIITGSNIMIFDIITVSNMFNFIRDVGRYLKGLTSIPAHFKVPFRCQDKRSFFLSVRHQLTSAFWGDDCFYILRLNQNIRTSNLGLRDWGTCG